MVKHDPIHLVSMSLSTRDESSDHQSDVFGLVNVGSICWFNSLVQSMLSAPEFVNALSRDSSPNNDPMVVEFKKILASRERTRNASPILARMIQAGVTVGFRQEDVSEGFLSMIDKIPADVSAVFESHWTMSLYCHSCKLIVSKCDVPDKATQVIMERDFIPVEKSGNPMAQFLSANMSFHEDYKCPKCGGREPKMRISQLTKPASVLVVSFNKFYEKWAGPDYSEDMEVSYMPEPKIRKTASYRLVAVIRHHGSAGGGHYNVIAARHGGLVAFDDTSSSQQAAWEPGNDDYMLFYALQGHI